MQLLVGLVAVIVLVLWIAGLARRVTGLEAGLRSARALIDDLERRLKPETAMPWAMAAPAAETGPAQEEATAPQDAAEAEALPVAEAATGGPGVEAPSPVPVPAGGTVPLPESRAAPIPPFAAVVERRDGGSRFDALLAWSRQHWTYLVGAVSLALAGIFLVQFGLEQGLIGPGARIVLALLFGIALLAGGEALRRRRKNRPELPAYVPTALAAAGLVVVFGAIWGAYRLYGLIAPELAFAGLGAAGLLGIVLGWVHGPLLVVVGLLGSAVTPVLVGGSGPSFWLDYYYAILLVVGLAIDSLKKWGWVSYLAQATTWLMVVLVSQMDQSLHQVVFALLFFAAAAALPRFELWPRLDGPVVPELVAFGAARDGATRPVLATTEIIALIGAVGAVLLLAMATERDAGLDLTRMLGMAALLVLVPLWTWRAPALVDAAAIFVLGLALVLASTVAPGYFSLPAPSGETTRLIMIAALVAALLFVPLALWRGEADPPRHAYWSALAALAAPLAALAANAVGNARDLFGASVWAAILSGLAAAMALALTRVARRDPEARLAMSLFLVSAFGLIVFALVTLLSDAALTLALMAVAVAMIFVDDRFDLKLMDKAAMLVLIAVSVRLVLFPGVWWSIRDGAVWEVMLLHGGIFVLAVGALTAFRARNRASIRIYLESLAVMVPALLLSILVYRWLDTAESGFGHLGLGLVAGVWLTSALAQAMRLKIDDGLARVRLALFWTAIAFAVLAESVIVLFANPLFDAALSARIVGPVAINSLLIAFGLPAALAFVIGRVTRPLRPLWSVWSNWLAFALMLAYLALDIRLLWHGGDIRLPGLSDGELYSYTIAMIAVSGLQLLYALYRRRPRVRHVAFAGLGIAAAKVFLIDMAGLSGLYRVGAFLALGFVLIGLAWLNTRFASRFAPAAKDASVASDAAATTDS